MNKIVIILASYSLSFLAQAEDDYFAEFAKAYEAKHPEIHLKFKPFPSAEEVLKGWSDANSHFKPGYIPVLDENGRLTDWVPPRKCPD